MSNKPSPDNAMLLARQFISFIASVYPNGLTKEQHQVAAWCFFAGAKGHERVLELAMRSGSAKGAQALIHIKEEVNMSAQMKLDCTAGVINPDL